ncbi:MAG: 4Fe-4S dicluster domain-containing protein [Candidatus Limnocylindrales bacterium]
MSVLVDQTFLPTLKKYGAFDIDACFNCGNCTAVCPLSTEDATFPRRIIRYAQVGMKDELLSSKELWTCYYCGECSDTCPRQADPGQFMAAARRYAIASYDRTGLARTMYTSPVLGSVIAILLAAFFALFMYTDHGPQSATSLALFQFIPEGLIHNLGVALIILVFLAGLSGVFLMARGISRKEGISWSDVWGSRAALGRSIRALWIALGVESLGQNRYRVDCETVQEDRPWYRRRWFIHAATMWGFLGLLAATILDYGLAVVGIKATGTPVPIWYPVRLLGTVAGIALIYGVTLLIVDRLQRSNRSASDSTAADWTLLVLLWITGITGFLIELALYLPQPPDWGYWVFLFHVSVAMELVILAPFMKFAHAVYRPVALFFYSLAGEKKAAGNG